MSLIYFAPQTLNSSRDEYIVLFIVHWLAGLTQDTQLLQFFGQKRGPVIGFSATGQRIIAVFRTAGHDLLT